MLTLIAGGVIASAKRLAASPPDSDDPKLAGHLSGQVTGRDGKPVSRARVFLAPLSDGHDDPCRSGPRPATMAALSSTLRT